MDEKIGSSSDQSEINAFSQETSDKNVEVCSLESDKIHSWIKKKGQWDIGRQFLLDWVSKIPFIEPIPPTNEIETSREVICIICS
jgi:hypothetical protein